MNCRQRECTFWKKRLPLLMRVLRGFRGCLLSLPLSIHHQGEPSGAARWACPTKLAPFAGCCTFPFIKDIRVTE